EYKDNELLMLEVILPSDAINFDLLPANFYITKDGYTKEDTIFDTAKIELSLDEKGILEAKEEYHRNGKFKDTYHSINRQINMYFSKDELDIYNHSRDGSRIYFIDANSSGKYPFNHYSFSVYTINSTNILNDLTITYKAYGFYQENEGKFIYFLYPYSEFSAKELDFKIKLPDNLENSDIQNINVRNSHMNLPVKINQSGKEISFNAFGLYRKGFIKVEIDINPEKMSSPSIFYITYLALLYHYEAQTDGFIISSIAGSILTLVFSFIGIGKFRKQRRKAKVVKDIKKWDKDFSSDLLLAKVKKTASLLNSAWLSGNMKKVRSIVSGGIYTRFQMQLDLMKKQGIQNYMKNWEILNLEFDSISSTDNLTSLHIKLTAKAKDLNASVNIKPENLESLFKVKKSEKYIEYWSFIRAKGAKSKRGQDILENKCPNCGSDIKNSTDQNKCRACDAVFNSGKYDWVLSEITQEVEWTPYSSPEIKDWDSIRNKFPFLSRQILEDRASVLFWKWIQCYSTGENKYIEREISPKKKLVLTEGGKYIRDVAVGSVDLVEIKTLEEELEARLLIKWSAAFSEKSAPRHRESDIYIRAKLSLEDKFGIAEHGCESCGAPLPEIDSIECGYCKSPIPTKINDWYFYNLKHLV
ncbi:MAG: TIM44-like domain-containing protein, partial [Leptospiraceae bacterium]|nr:TIM44-like domain-containing protein [Leptospiraceae bacterium]